jgi:hypothetical protein
VPDKKLNPFLVKIKNHGNLVIQLKDGHLYCPEKYAKPNAVFNVIVSLPEPDATQNDIETA